MVARRRLVPLTLLKFAGSLRQFAFQMQSQQSGESLYVLKTFQR